MNSQSEMNRKSWSYRAYEFWTEHLGPPNEVANDMKKQPEKYLKRHLEFLGDVRGKKVANLLGSNGRKAVPLSLLGAEVTIVDISEENQKYATELANAANVNLKYIISDFIEWNIEDVKDSFDIAYLEGGILHYFSDLNSFSKKIYNLLKLDGKLVLNDFHPIRKILKEKDVLKTGEDILELAGNYFDCELHKGEVAYEKYFSVNEQSEFPKCLLRYWTLGEIISSFASAGFVIEKFVEGPRFDSHQNIPGEFTLVASKLKIERKKVLSNKSSD